jgi:hypothetical protein
MTNADAGTDAPQRTVTVIDAEVWLFPARSVATADSTCWPPVLFRVFHGICHGALVTVPSRVPSR